MKPRVFISSTIHDLEQVRVAVRAMLEEELCYEPVMSEFYDIGYDPRQTAAASCLTDIPTCNLGVLIIGKRYGKPKKGELSVTHQEYNTLCNNKIPTFILMDEELSVLHRVHTDNPQKRIKMREMDNPAMTFEFINEIKRGESNSAYIEFKNHRDACEKLRLQLAHYFTKILNEKKQQSNTTIEQILAETISLKKLLKNKSNADESQRYLKATTALMKEDAQHYRAFLERMLGTLEQGVDRVLRYSTFRDLVRALNLKIEVVNELDAKEIFTPTADFKPMAFWSLPFPHATSQTRQPIAGYGMTGSSTLRITKFALDNFVSMHKNVKISAG